MPEKIDIDKEVFKKEFKEGFKEKLKNVKGHRHPGHEQFGKVMHMHVDNEVKLFTDKSEMVNFVNQLENIHDVDIFKIEDGLYKVRVSKRVRKEHCKQED